MREKLAEAEARFKSFWFSLQRWQRASLIVSAILVLGGVLAAAMLVGRTAYAPLFSGMDLRDQDAVVSFLKEEKIPYRTDPKANAILVPSSHVYEARIALAGRGVPSGGVVGYERFDQAKMGMTSFREKLTYYRALEGELTRTIMSVNSVASARVSIVAPEQTLFIEQEKPSTAAVLLKLKQGASFGQDQARAIVHLVASSVEGLTPENVTLVDADGRLPFDDILDDTLSIQSGSKIVLRHREFEKDYERELEKKIRDTLEKVYGRGKIKAAVRVELDFDKRQKNHRIVQPEPGRQSGVIQSVQNTEESYTGPAGISGGIPGTTTNIPGYLVNSGTGQGNASYERADNVTNYDNTTLESQEVESPGKVRRLTATVLIDGKLNQRQIGDWREAVATAIGVNEARGDRLSIMAMPFDNTEELERERRLGQERRRRLVIGISSFILLLVAVTAGFILWLRRRRQVIGEERAAREDGQPPSLRQLLENPDLMTSQGELAVLEEQLRNYALNNPEEFANLIKNWVVEDL